MRQYDRVLIGVGYSRQPRPIGMARSRSLTFDPTLLVSTDALFAALTAAGWRYTGAEHLPDFGEGSRGAGPCYRSRGRRLPPLGNILHPTVNATEE